MFYGVLYALRISPYTSGHVMMCSLPGRSVVWCVALRLRAGEWRQWREGGQAENCEVCHRYRYCNWLSQRVMASAAAQPKLTPRPNIIVMVTSDTPGTGVDSNFYAIVPRALSHSQFPSGEEMDSGLERDDKVCCFLLVSFGPTWSAQLSEFLNS